MKINTPEKSALNSKTKYKAFNFNESQPCHGEGICITQWSYEAYHAGPPKKMGHSGEFWQNMVHWRRECQTNSVFSPWESHEQYEKAKNRTLKVELPRSVGAQYDTGDSGEIRNNEGVVPKQKQHPVVDVIGDGSKVKCCKEQYCIGTWNVRPMNQGKLEVVKQEMARVNVNILGISELRWTGMGEFNSWPFYLLLSARIL